MKNIHLFIFSVVGALLLLGNTTTINSTASIKGKITDATQGEAIISASVLLLKGEELVKGTVTDWDGNYSFQGITPGTYDIKVQYVGYPNKHLKDIVLEKGTEKRLDIQLEANSIVLDEVVVRGYKTSLIQKDRTTQGVVTSSNDIKNLPTRNVNALTAQTAGAAKSNSGEQVAIRGSRTPNTYYYIDGVRVQAEAPQQPNSKPKPKAKPKVKRNTTQKKEAKQIDEEVATIKDSIVEPQHHEQYEEIKENPFVETAEESTSTFSIDVDNAAYSNVRRFVNNNQLPPADAVRIEEMINYFDYDYAQPKEKTPFNVVTEVAPCPWNPTNYLLHIGLQGKEIDRSQLPSSNIVFLLDVSGSMNSHNKLPLLKSSLALLTDQLSQNDQVSIVVYAGAAGLVLPSTNGSEKTKIKTALNNLRSGGGTAGGQGIKLAYAEARKHFIKGGNNRVILATDGDFNIGVSSDEQLVKLIEKERESGVFLSILGFGTGNYQDAKMQKLANKGNGNHYYIDSYEEAKKVLLNEFGGTMFAIAKDVKIQVQFDKEVVKSYRLVGYENRMLANEDFANDKIDAGELGSGHTVTALYEIEITRDSDDLGVVENSKGELHCPISPLGQIDLRYKQPDENTSTLVKTTMAYPITDFEKSSDNFRWAAAIAEYGLVLRNSKYKKTASLAHIQSYAMGAKGKDHNGYRQGFLDMLLQTTKISSLTK